MSEALDLFAFLSKLNRRDKTAFDNLNEEAQKSAHPFVIMRWLSGTNDRAQIVRINEFANKYMFSLGAEKPLLFKLLAAACTGNTTRSTWIKGPSNNGTKLTVQAIQSQFKCSIREAEEYIRMLEPSDIIKYAESAGWDKDQIKKLTAELGKPDGQRNTTKSSRK